MEKQRTIKTQVSLKGIGIHTGRPVNITFKPAPENSGISFVRIDLPGKPVISANISHLLDSSLRLRRTSIGKDSAQVHTIEHFMAAFCGSGIDNIYVDIDGPEPPGLDGSAIEIVNILKKAGITTQKALRKEIIIDEPFWIEEEESAVIVLPNNNMSVSYTLDYSHLGLRPQHNHFRINEDVFQNDIAPSRTFCFKKEAQQLIKQGLGKGASSENTIIIDEAGRPSVELRFKDEPLRHKMLDIVGDFFLTGHFIRGHIIGIKSGHSLNLKMSQKIIEKYLGCPAPAAAGHWDSAEKPLMNKKQIEQILPHRDPFLLIDEILQMSDTSAVGIKYVNEKEYYFKGHFPGRPIMPGVLILESMAQVGGVLMLNKSENKDKLAYFMCIDNAKFRRAIIPGDKIKFEVEVTRYRTKTGQIHGKAYVDESLVCEADLMFSLVD
ncbi:MAG: UDP-3-O-[3-hydroxymyristoyl] N-acetylglucosamine deacetylase [Candidatus Omnitrophica bacterium]|nr:UDP-3-O-[3-hydroxymyristoyl] N-acetylglucosamine deacetylase [Candidatus Omnitrophota bacterium]